MNRLSAPLSQNPLSGKLESLPFRHPVLVSFGITLFLLCIQLHFIRPYFLQNDDIFKILTARGIGVNSTPSPYFLCSGIPLGVFFVKWFEGFPSFPWYGWFICAVQFLSLWSFLWILCLRSSGFFNVALFIVSCLGVQCIFFIFFEFTITSMMAFSACVILFNYSTELPGSKLRNSIWFFSGIFLLLSWLIRPYSFYAMLLVTAPILVFKIREMKLRVLWEQQWKFFTLAGFFLLLVFFSDYSWYQRNPDWKVFQKFNSVAAELQQFQNPTYTPQTKSLFDSVGWTENDLWLFDHWYWMDPDKYEISKMTQLSSGFPKVGAVKKVGSFNSLPELLGSFWDLRILLYFSVFWMFCGGRASRFLLAQLAWIMLYFIYLIYFLKAPDRVTLPPLAYLMNLAIYYAAPPIFPKWKNGPLHLFLLSGARIIFLGAAFVFVLPNLHNYYLQNLERQKVESQMRSLLRQVHPLENQVYFTWGLPFELFGAFDTYDFFKPFHLVTASFIQRSPVTQETLDRFGIGNILKDAVDNPNIFVICGKEEGSHYYTYMEENFHISIYAQKVFDGGYFKIYSIHSRKDF